jgi:hypothetical protein
MSQNTRVGILSFSTSISLPLTPCLALSFFDLLWTRTQQTQNQYQFVSHTCASSRQMIINLSKPVTAYEMDIIAMSIYMGKLWY